MKLRMCSLWLAGVFSCACSLWFAATLLAEPPKAEPVSSVAVDRANEKTSSPMPVDRDEAQILIEAVIYEVDQAKLVKLAETPPSPVKELLKANGFKLPKASEKRSMLTAIRDEPLSLKNQEVNEAFKKRAAPSIVALAGHSATFRSGGEFPVPASKDSFSDVGLKIGFREFGTGLSLLPLIEADGKIALDLRVEETTVDRDNSVEVSGIEVPASRSQAMSLAAKLKSGQYLLIANGTTEADLTQFVQLKVRVLTAEEIAKQPVRQDARPAAPATAGENTDALAAKSVTKETGSPYRTHGPIVGEPDRRSRTVLYEVRIYEIDQEAWGKETGVAERTKQLDDLLKPFASGWRGAKLVSDDVRAWATKSPISKEDVAKLKPAVSLISAPQLAVPDGQMALFDYGGKTPQIEMNQRHGNGFQRTSSGVHRRQLATTFGVQSQVSAAGRVQVAVHYLAHRDLKKSQITLDDLKTHGSIANAELSVGQTLCLTDANPNSSDRSDALLITVTPTEIQLNDIEEPITPIAKTDKPVEKTIVVEDRWPLAAIKVGQRVIPIPVAAEKTSLSADMLFLQLASVETSLAKVIAIEELADSKGRRVTLLLPPFDGTTESTLLTKFLEQIETSLTTVVIPASSVSPTDIYEGRQIREIFDRLPTSLRPRPVELAIGESITMAGVTGFMAQSQPAGTKKELGSFDLDLLDDDLGGFWNAKATRPGMTRVVQLMVGNDAYGPCRLTDYLIKADTRELEHHLREQFPKSNVTITSLGTNSLLLSGTAAADDSRGIVELAEQFAPKVLNRLKVGESEVRIEPRELGTRARPIQPASGRTTAGERQGVSPPTVAIREVRRGANAAPLAEPPRVQPASATSSKKTDQLRELLDEIRELRRDVRRLNELLEREHSARPLGEEKSAVVAAEFDKLVAQYNELMGQQRFAEAEVIGKQAKELEPKNLAAETMVFRAALARRMAVEKKEATAASSIPLHNAEWSETQPTLREPLAAGIADADRAAAAKLDQMIVWEMVDLPLSEAVKLLAKDVGINIVLDKRGLEEAGVDPESRISRTLKGVKLRSALKIVLDPLKLGHVFDGEVLKITSRERAAGPPLVVAYPVADLLGNGETDSELRRLRDLIMVTVRGETHWIEAKPSVPKIHCDGATKSLVVRHSSDVHDEVAAFLSLLRKTKQAATSTKKPVTNTLLSDEEQRINERLQTKITLSFKNAPLKEVISQIAKQAELNIVLDSAGLEEVGETTKTPVTLNLDQVRISTALRLLLEPLQLDHVVQNEVLRVTSRQRAEGALVIVTYPVTNLAWRDNDLPSDLADLCDLLMSMVEPNSWEIAGGPATVRGNATTRCLVVRQTHANHARIRELLESLRKLSTEKSTSNAQGKRQGRDWSDLAKQRSRGEVTDDPEDILTKT